MAKSTDAFPAQLRSSVITQFTSAIQSVPEGPKKDQLDVVMSTLQSDLNGMTGLEASERIRQAIGDMKEIVTA
jgi:CheY-like chemotaxis protein